MAIAAAPQLNATDEPEMEEGNSSEHIKAMLLGILLLAGVAVLLIFGCLTLMYRRGGMTPLEAMQTQFGTWSQPDVCRHTPVGQMEIYTWGEGCFEPCLPFVEPPDHVQWLYTTR